MDPDGQEVQMNPWKEYCETRFLSRSPAIERIRHNLPVLQGYFNSLEEVKPSLDPISNYDANWIASMLNDKSVMLYLTFLSPVLQEFEKVNASFQVIIYL